MPTVQEVFQQFDVDKSGEIDSSELGNALAAAGAAVSPTQLDALLREIDTDKDGKVSLSEFERFVRQHKLVTKSGNVDSEKLINFMATRATLQAGNLEAGLLQANTQLNNIKLRIRSGEATEQEKTMLGPLTYIFACYASFAIMELGIAVWALVAAPDGLNRGDTCKDFAIWMLVQAGGIILSCLLGVANYKMKSSSGDPHKKTVADCPVCLLGCFLFGWLIYGCTLFPMDDVAIYDGQPSFANSTVNYDDLCRNSQYMAGLGESDPFFRPPLCLHFFNPH